MRPTSKRWIGSGHRLRVLRERSELSGEAPQAMPVEGVLNPINCQTQVRTRVEAYFETLDRLGP